MTEHINLDTVEAYLTSIVLPQGNLIPVPLVVIDNETSLYDDPGFIEEMDSALAEERPAKINAEIINIETYKSNLITVTFVSSKLEESYRLNIPRQLLQVGYVYDRLLHAPACSILTEAEVQMNRDFNNEKVSGEYMPPFVSDDIMVWLTFPKDISDDDRNKYSKVLNNFNKDFTGGVSKEEIRDISPKVNLIVEQAESHKLREEVITMLLGLVEGNEEALVQLYDWAEHVDSAKATLDKNAILNEADRHAVITFEMVASIVNFLHPVNMVQNIAAITRSMNADDEPEDDASEALLDDLFSDDLASSLTDILSDFRQENPDTVTINEDSTYDERVEYLSLPSNSVPLMGGLLKLSDRINVEMYSSIDWNRNEVTEDEYGTRGEYLIILALLAVQRIQMFGKSIDITDEVQNMKTLALSLSIEALTHDAEIELWFLKEALYKAGRGDSDSLFQYLVMEMEETPANMQVTGIVGQIMHWLGHAMVDEDHTREEMLKAFADLPIIRGFVKELYDAVDGLPNDNDSDDDDDDDDEDEDEICFVTDACFQLPFIEDEPNLPLVEEITAALIEFSKISLRKDDKEIKEDSVEWKEALGTYLNRILSDD